MGVIQDKVEAKVDTATNAPLVAIEAIQKTLWL
jgi:hypothetical protein